MQAVLQLIPVETYVLEPTHGPAVLFRGRRLLQISSQEVEVAQFWDRWYVLTLYCEENGHFVLAIEYRSETTSPHEQETPRLDVVRGRDWPTVADAISRHDFMDPVKLDHGGGGHVCLMDLATQTHFELVVTFQVMAARFLETVARRRDEWSRRYDTTVS